MQELKSTFTISVKATNGEIVKATGSADLTPYLANFFTKEDVALIIEDQDIEELTCTTLDLFGDKHKVKCIGYDGRNITAELTAPKLSADFKLVVTFDTVIEWGMEEGEIAKKDLNYNASELVSEYMENGEVKFA